MDRVLKSTPATISNTWYENGAVVDPGSVTVTIKRLDGTTVTSGSAGGTGASARTFSLSVADTALLDTLTATWVSATKGTMTTVAEVVGGFLFTVAEARALEPLADTTDYPVATIEATRALVEQALEDACGVAFVPRYKLETVSGGGTTVLVPTTPKIRSVRSAIISGTAVTLTDLSIGSGSLLHYARGWPHGFGNIILGYEHGYDYPPERVRRAALRLARRWLVEGPVDDRATSMSTEDGTFNLVTPGLRGAMFDLPEVNAVVEQYSYHVSVA